MDKSIAKMNEMELYFVIDSIGAFIWRMNHDMAHGRIPQESHAAIDNDIANVRKQQVEAIQQLPRFGVDKPLEEDGRATPEYWTWYRTWDAWKHGISDEKWQEVDAALTRGLTDEEVSAYKTEAFKGNGNG